MLTLVLLAILAGPQCGTNYQYSHIIYLSENPSGGDGCMQLTDTIPQFRQIFVLISTTGATGAEFSAPLPNCVTGATYLSDEPVFPIVIGNSQTGVSIAFGSCRSGDAVHVLTINYMMAGLTETCCHYRVLPLPNSRFPGQITLSDCDFEAQTGQGGALLISRSSATTVDNPDPPDGATNQPLSVRLTWTEHRCDCTLCATFADLYFGTTTDPPLVSRLGNGGPGEYPYDPGLLEPYTTYYWKVGTYGAGEPWMSPLWSFTTTSAIPTESVSWGAIKALYTE
jgi:hypothetical protein